MTVRQTITLFLLLCLQATLCSAELNLPTKKIKGEEYYYYTVKSGETIYGISRKLQISEEEILKYNPTASEGLRSKQQLFFPVRDFAAAVEADAASEADVPSSSTVIHTVEKGESLSGIAKMYGVDKDEILAVNPEAGAGLKVGQKLTINVSRQAAGDAIFVTVAQGETLYSLASKYNTTVEIIMGENPGVSPSNFQEGSVVKITPNSARPVERERVITEFYPYEVKKGDTFKSIARKCGITESELRAANPDVSKPKKGKILYIPVLKSITETVVPNTEADTAATTQAEQAIQIYEDTHDTKEEECINVALMLPFMLREEAPARQAMLYTEFYKGFLMAVDDVRGGTDKHINVYAYDTEGSTSRVKSILRRDELKKMDLVFAPDDTTHLGEIARFGRDNGVNVVNAFVIKNELYLDNPRFFQVNIPQSYMIQKVLEWIDSSFAGYEIVFLKCAEGGEKEIIPQLKAHIQGGRDWREIAADSPLSGDSLSAVLQEGGKYLFIPNVATKRALNRILPALSRVKETRDDIDMALFGYPEWTTYMADFGPQFHKIDTYLYSRFYVDETSKQARTVLSTYNGWYGEDMIYAAPRFGLLGYDTGLFFMQAYVDGNTDFTQRGKNSEGLQNAFMFERLSNWSGLVNKAMFFVHLQPGTNEVKRALR